MAAAQNHLLELVSRADRQRLLGLCELVPLVLTQVLCDVGQATRHVYFPSEGYISLITVIDGRPSLEVGMVGREGMLGAELALGVQVSPMHALVQGPGTAWRMAASVFTRELARSPGLRRVMHRYVHVLLVQMAGSAACVRFHQIGPRLARWLLMTHDRAKSPKFRVTHEFVAYMLGVRRVGITAAAGDLQRSGLIEYRRGEVSVLDREGLEAAACGCYAQSRLAYDTAMT